ncbi:hypothetical protein [Luedemannella helvata]|uniref:Peptidoglycan-binding protein n=1 Tax=Luedemannella helvata TaxID=349315 RepID=A0ABN2KZT3_9ACTN
MSSVTTGEGELTPTTAPEPDVSERAPQAPAPHRREPGRRRRFLFVGGTVLVLGAAAGGVFAVTSTSQNAAAEPNAAEQTAAGLVPVRKGALSAQVNQSGTLSYAAQADGSSYSVINQQAGIYTKLPAAGSVVKCGKVLYWVDDNPVLLLCGSRPPYRDLSYGREGWDVKALNANLRALGYASEDEIDDGEDEFTGETAEALEDLQEDIGADETGRLNLGDAVFLPGPLRITKAIPKLGTRAAPGTAVVEAATTVRQVVVQLNAAQQSFVKKGFKVSITLPNNKVTPGKVSRIGTVASSSGDQGDVATSGSTSSDATIPVYISLDKPNDAGTLDAAPVRVQITTEGVKDALIVPVTALIGIAGGGYAVERVNADGSRESVPVELGLFDNANGLVQVEGALAPGDRVVVPAS